MWFNNEKVIAAFVSNDAQWAWANIEGIGWRRIKEGSSDGLPNIFTIVRLNEIDHTAGTPANAV